MIILPTPGEIMPYVRRWLKNDSVMGYDETTLLCSVVIIANHTASLLEGASECILFSRASRVDYGRRNLEARIALEL